MPTNLSSILELCNQNHVHYLNCIQTLSVRQQNQQTNKQKTCTHPHTHTKTRNDESNEIAMIVYLF